jgi:hypothetical protein
MRIKPTPVRLTLAAWNMTTDESPTDGVRSEPARDSERDALWVARMHGRSVITAKDRRIVARYYDMAGQTSLSV